MLPTTVDESLAAPSHHGEVGRSERPSTRLSGSVSSTVDGSSSVERSFVGREFKSIPEPLEPVDFGSAAFGKTTTRLGQPASPALFGRETLQELGTVEAISTALREKRGAGSARVLPKHVAFLTEGRKPADLSAVWLSLESGKEYEAAKVS